MIMPDFSDISESHQQIMIEAVHLTAASLDEHVPNWVSLIDWDDFNFISYQRCVEGQLKRHSDVDWSRLTEVKSVGFDVPMSVKDDYPRSLPVYLWDFMGEEWKKISKRNLTTTA